MTNLSQFGSNSTTRVKSACLALQSGKGVILVDDEDRENEGDLIFSTTHLTQANVNTMIQDCSGIICLCIKRAKADELDLPPMVLNNTSKYQTPFTVSIEAKENISTGVSARDRWVTIKSASRKNASSKDIVKPGHVFPLVAHEQGVLERRGHTEGSVDLMEIAGLEPSAVLCELMNADGTMQKLPELISYAHKHNLMILSVDDIYQFRVALSNGMQTTIVQEL